MTEATSQSGAQDLARRLQPGVRRPKVTLLVEPFHSLGQTVCRQLAREGLRPVVVSNDPGRGEAFSIRMAIEGYSVPHRTLHDEFRECEQHLARDLDKVFGGLRGVISFFRPIRASHQWLTLPIIVADALLRRAVNQRLQLLQAVAPLLAERGFLLDVVMGVANAAGEPVVAVEGLTARLWDGLLGGELERRGILVRRTYTRFSVHPGEIDFRRDAQRVIDEFHRCLLHTAARHEAHARR